MHKKILLILALLMGLSTSALAWKNALFTHREDYYKTLKRFTRHDSDISMDNLSDKMEWYATYKTPEFSSAFRVFYSELYPNNPANLANQRAQVWMGENGQTEFFVAFYAQARDLERLDRDSLWDLSLRADNRVYKPSLIEKIQATSLERKFFPFVENWHQTYRVVFPVRPTSSTTVELQIQGAGGVSSLHF